jgi:hypothetical protein
VKLGVIVPQGWTGEYDGWEPERGWERTIAVAQQAERIGAESIWLFDHFHTVPRPTDEITFESVTSLAALAAVTDELREALRIIRARCEEIDRDPDSLAVSVHIWWGTEQWRAGGAARQELLRAYADLGVSRIMGLLQPSADSDEALDGLADDARAAGVELA